MTEASEIDLSEVPITAITERTRAQIELSLNDRMVIPTDEGDIPRDWRGLAHFTGLDFQVSPQSHNPVGDILNLWGKDELERPSLRDLQAIFCQLDRWDVYYDTEEMMMSDAKRYRESLQVKPMDSSQSLLYGCLTHDDVHRFQKGLKLTEYDAFLLYAEEDLQDARLMVKRLETDYMLRVFFKDRDLLSGVGFEFQAIANLMERSSTVIVILSPDFLNSNINNYFLAYAQTLNIEQRKRIIQCIIRQCELPQLLRCMFSLSRARLESLNINFWERVYSSVCAALPPSSTHVAYQPSIQLKPEAERCTITEITEPISPTKVPITGQTAIICTADRSTHYPGTSRSAKEPSDIDIDDSDSEKMKGTKNSFLSKLKKKKWFKQRKNWFKKKQALTSG